MAKIVFIGAGNLATHLSQALQGAGHEIVQVYSRTQESASLLVARLGLPFDAAITSLEDLNPSADIYIYALRDAVLPEIVAKVQVSPMALHLHTAGSVPMSVFGEDKPNAGVLYPFQTFSKEKAVDFEKIPILIESVSGKSVSLKVLSLARSISPMVYEADAEARAKLHLAGVFACNFVNCLYAIAEEQLQGSGLPFEVLLPLIEETATKVHTIAPREAQTGPAIRHDETIMNKHINRLPNEELKELYRLLSQNIQAHEK